MMNRHPHNIMWMRQIVKSGDSISIFYENGKSINSVYWIKSRFLRFRRTSFYQWNSFECAIHCRVIAKMLPELIPQPRSPMSIV